MRLAADGEMIFILYVKDQQQSREFYRKLLGIDPVLDVTGMTEFELSGNARLGLMPENSIMGILDGKIRHPGEAGGASRCEVYFYVDDPVGYYDTLVQAGGTGVSKAAERSWGDVVSYGLDPDGHILAFARKQSSEGD